MRHTATTPLAAIAAAECVIGAALLIDHHAHRHSQPTEQQLTDAHRAGYALALTHVSRGLLTPTPEDQP